MKVGQVLFPSLCFLITSASLSAWGRDGHQIVGRIAESYLTAKVRAEIRTLLGKESLAEASTWADQILSNEEYSWSSSLHYINLPKQTTTIDLTRDCKDDRCVVAAVNRFSKELADPGLDPDRRAQALKFLIHFVADVHQPLHVSYSEDQGGNGIATDFNEDWPNLHWVWDTGLLKTRMGKRNWKSLARKLKNEIRNRDKKRWRRNLDPEKWAQECVPITRGIYTQLNWPENEAFRELPPGYYHHHIGIIQDRLKIAGVRLAALLNRIFD